MPFKMAIKGFSMFALVIITPHLQGNFDGKIQTGVLITLAVMNVFAHARQPYLEEDDNINAMVNALDRLGSYLTPFIAAMAIQADGGNSQWGTVTIIMLAAAAIALLALGYILADKLKKTIWFAIKVTLSKLPSSKLKQILEIAVKNRQNIKGVTAGTMTARRNRQ